MASTENELRRIEDARYAMQQDEGRFAQLHAFDALAEVLLDVLQEVRELREEVRRNA